MNKKGAAFLTTIILLGIAVAASTAASVMLLKDAFTVKRLKSSAQAYYLAEAGSEKALQSLWYSIFDLSQFPINLDLGEGHMHVEIDQSKWGTDNILLISSTGTVNNISRCMKVTVLANAARGLNYAILADGKVNMADKTIINCNNAVGVHSNCAAFTTWGAVHVPGVVNGNVSAVGYVGVVPPGSITGSILQEAPAVSLPSFDATFFNYYLNRASGSGNVYTPPGGTQTFNNNPNLVLVPESGVIYVNGSVSIEGDVSMVGCIVATGNIDVNTSTVGRFTQNLVDNLPALMSSGGDIRIGDRTTLNGLVYAAGNINVGSPALNYGDIQINGSIMSKMQINPSTGTTLNYIKQIPQGLGADTMNPVGWILNWQEDSPY